MIKAAVARTPILVSILMFFALGYTVAQTRVVVVPLGSIEPTLDVYYGSITSAGAVETGDIVCAVRVSTGNYSLGLGRSTLGCAPTVTRGIQVFGTSNIGGNSSASIPVSGSTINIRFVSDSSNGVNSDFHIVVVCPKV